MGLSGALHCCTARSPSGRAGVVTLPYGLSCTEARRTASANPILLGGNTVQGDSIDRRRKDASLAVAVAAKQHEGL